DFAAEALPLLASWRSDASGTGPGNCSGSRATSFSQRVLTARGAREPRTVTCPHIAMPRPAWRPQHTQKTDADGLQESGAEIHPVSQRSQPQQEDGSTEQRGLLEDVCLQRRCGE